MAVEIKLENGLGWLGLRERQTGLFTFQLFARIIYKNFIFVRTLYSIC